MPYKSNITETNTEIHKVKSHSQNSPWPDIIVFAASQAFQEGELSNRFNHSCCALTAQLNPARTEQNIQKFCPYNE